MSNFQILKLMDYNGLNEIEGLQFIPVDQFKRPIPKEWQSKIEKYDLSKCHSVGLVCGSPSGGVEVVDIDLKYDLTGTVYERFKQIVHQMDELLLKKMVVQKTKSGGYHWIYRCTKIGGNLKLANRSTTEEERLQTYAKTYNAEIQKSVEDDVAKKRAKAAKENDNVRVLFETRGIGGQIVISPSKGYDFVFGDLLSIQEITPHERDILHDAAMQFNEVFEEIIVPKKSTIKINGLSPFDDYNERGDIVKLLEDHGWNVVGQKGKKTVFLRPGHTTSKSSGNFDHNLNWFSVFTTSTEFEPQKAYLPYSVFAILECNKDYSEAAKRLVEMGYGEKKELKKETQSTRVIKSRINIEDENFSFLATGSDYEEYLHQVRSGTLQQGLTTGFPSLDQYFLFKEGNLVMTNGIDNTGKALCLKTPIPTPEGWTTMGDIKIGDDIFDENGRICSVIKATDIQYDKKCYKVIFSNREEIICCEDHLWEIQTINKFKKVMSVKQMVSYGIKKEFNQKTLNRYTIDLPTRGKSIQIVEIVTVESVPVRCIEVDSKSHLFLCGKTMIPTHNSVFVWYLAMISAMLHGWKWIVFSSENTLGAFMRKCIQFYWGKQLYGQFAMSDSEYKTAKLFVEDHFKLIKAQEDLYNYRDIINMVKKTRVKYPQLKCGMIDPYNSLKIDMNGFSKLSTHEYHYEALSELKAYGQQTKFGWYINNHAVTAALRTKDENRYPVAPRKEDTEGGGKFSNKADDFITIHRITQHPTDWMITEIHVRKIKDTETGGRPTPHEVPAKFEMYRNGTAFVERLYEGGRAIDPIHEWHYRTNPIQSEVIFSDTKVISMDNVWKPYKDDNETDAEF
jgi:hypothetical protein